MQKRQELSLTRTFLKRVLLAGISAIGVGFERANSPKNVYRSFSPSLCRRSDFASFYLREPLPITDLLPPLYLKPAEIRHDGIRKDDGIEVMAIRYVVEEDFCK
jgi:hypothetical protein